MSGDNRQFNHMTLSYAEIERRMKHARKLRSDAVARGIAWLAAAGARTRRWFAGTGGHALHAREERRFAVPRLGWLAAAPVAAARADRAACCK